MTQTENVVENFDEAAKQPINSRETTSSAVIPVIAEELRIGKQVVETAKVNIKKQVISRQELVDIPLIREDVVVERIAVNRYVETPPPPIRYEGNTMIIAVLREEVVVTKRLLLVEELHVTKQQVETHQPQSITLLKEAIEVTRTGTNNQ